MPDPHPFITHFPIALLSLSVVSDVVALLWKRPDVERFAWWSLLSGEIGLAAALLSGLLAKQNVDPASHGSTVLAVHEQLAFALLSVFSALLFWRVANKTRPPVHLAWLYLSASLVGLGLLWTTGWYGGELVFRYGFGVGR